MVNMRNELRAIAFAESGADLGASASPVGSICGNFDLIAPIYAEHVDQVPDQECNRIAGY